MILINKKINFLLILPLVAFLLLWFLRTTWFGELFWSFFLHILLIYLFYLVLVLVFISKKKLSLKNKPIIISVLIINFINLIFQSTLLINFSGPFKNLSPNDYSLKVMSVNVRFENENFAAINNLIKEENADVLILIELSSQIYGKIKDTINADYPYKSKTSSFYGYNQIFSKFPVIASADISASENNIGYLKAEIAAKDKTYRIYAAHANPPLTQESFAFRNQYLQTLARDINQELSGNLIVAGDFNVSPWSYYYQQFLKDTDFKIHNFSLSKGIILTWYFDPPVLASHLDYIFLGQNIVDLDFKTRSLEGSDHNALIATLY